MNKSDKVRFYLDKTGFFAECAMIFFVLAAVFLFFGCWGMWTDWVNYIMLTLLPILCCLLMTLCVLLLGRKGFFLSCIPVLLGVVSFLYRLLYSTSWVQTVLCVLFYVAIVVVYTGTVFGWIRTKWLLPPLFGLPFLYRLFVLDIPALSNTVKPVTFADGMKEMSLLGILAAMFCIGMGLKRRFAPKPAAAAPAPQPTSAPEAAPAQQPVSAPTAAPAPASAPTPAPAPQPAPATQPAPAEAAVQSTVIESTPEMNAFLSDEPYTPVLTLNPEPWEPEPVSGEKTDGNKNE